jgi:UDP-N-acetylmuramoylalanine--D-glutamate ligase
VVAWAEQQGIPVWGDVELAWRVRDKVRAGDWVSVTGAGASETVDLAVHLLASAGIRTAGVGYRNVPVLDAVRDPGGFDVLVVELSSRHLARLGGGAISPLVSVCLSVSEDSVSEDGVSDDGVVADGVDEDGVSADGDDPAWHASTEARLAALGNVYDATRLACLYNKADEATMHMVEEAEVIDGCRAIGFDFGTPGPSDLGLVGDIVVDRAFHDDRHHSALELTTHGELQAAGLGAPSSVSGVLAASAIARAFGVSPEQVRAGIATFRRTT